MEPTCTCPSYEGLTYEEILTVSGLLKRKNESKNCCEEAGYICSTLDRALKKAYNKRYSTKSDEPSSRKIGKHLRKKKLTYETLST